MRDEELVDLVVQMEEDEQKEHRHVAGAADCPLGYD